MELLALVDQAGEALVATPPVVPAAQPFATGDVGLYSMNEITKPVGCSIGPG
jgi:hypothetical protein